ncbi:MAG: heat-inducible transcription repressor HrcA [Ruminococcaceae bacterium]|nr:heat-inducible transcription repressor HrcA [Oscillospiraceae bacterium]
MEMTDRKNKILAAIVERYIRTGEPVGSKTLVDSLDFSVSSATVRNEMADLGDMGYLEQPHTSAGRIPSTDGYRYYVEHLMNSYEMSPYEKNYISMRLKDSVAEPHSLLEKAGSILADMTNCAAVSTTPADSEAIVKRIELVPIGTHTAMVLMMTSFGILKTKVCRSDTEITIDTAQTFYNIVKANFIGKPAQDINIAKIQTLALSLGEKALGMTPLLVALADLSKMTERTELLLEGQTNLLNYKEFESNAFELMDFLRRSEPLNRIFAHKTEHKDGQPSILIGRENLFKELQNSTLIFSRYSIAGHESGTLGIIGPTRIDYARLIPSIKYLTDVVGIILSDNMEE